MKRRSFFKSFMGLVATVALAPEIAFGRKLEFTSPQFYFPEPVPGEIWWYWSVKEGENEWLSTGEYCKRAMDQRQRLGEMRPYSELQVIRRKAGLTVD